MKIKSILISILLISGFLYAIDEKDIKSEATQKIEIITNILSNTNLTIDEKTQGVFEQFEGFFDFERMSSLSLGKNQWSALTKEQQQEFSVKFIDKLKHSYLDKLSLYSDEKIVVGDLLKPSDTRVQLPVQLINSSGEKYDMQFKFYNTKSPKGWLIYDVDILGVSIIQTYRSQFDGVLARSSFDELIKRIDTLIIDDNATKQ